MKKRKLISMLKFVLDKELDIVQNGVNFIMSHRYASFLDLEPKISMFVPCDEAGNPLEDLFIKEPNIEDYRNEEGGNMELYRHNIELHKESLKAKEKVQFEGFKLTSTRGGYRHVTNGRLEFVFDQYGCWLNPYDSCNGIRVNSIEQLANLNLPAEHLSLTESLIKKYHL